MNFLNSLKVNHNDKNIRWIFLFALFFCIVALAYIGLEVNINKYEKVIAANKSIKIEKPMIGVKKRVVIREDELQEIYKIAGDNGEVIKVEFSSGEIFLVIDIKSLTEILPLLKEFNDKNIYGVKVVRIYKKNRTDCWRCSLLFSKR